MFLLAEARTFYQTTPHDFDFDTCVYWETQSVWSGMAIAWPFEFWSHRFDTMPVREFCEYLKALSRKVNISKFVKSRRGPKKKVTKKGSKSQPCLYVQNTTKTEM